MIIMRFLPHRGAHRGAPDPDSLLPAPAARWVLALAGTLGVITVVMAARA
jgi:hypothetical protein